MSIKMVRVDDRLIHGQIVAAWVKSLNLERVWIIDDGTANDNFLKNVMRMVAPSNTELVISAESEIEQLASQYDKDDCRTLVLVKYPYVAQKLFESDIEFRNLDIGGIGDNASRKKVYKNISMTDQEIQCCREMKENGVNVYIQVTPDDKQIPFNY